MMYTLRVISFNCHGFNMSTAQYLRRLSESVGVILLQETWLCDVNCCGVSDALVDFIMFHTSAMEGKFATGMMSVDHMAELRFWCIRDSVASLTV